MKFGLIRKSKQHGIWRNLSVLMTILAVLLNLGTPVTHAAMVASGPDGMLEICTGDGVKYISLTELGLQAPETNEVDGDVTHACADCPVCWFGKVGSQEAVMAGHLAMDPGLANSIQYIASSRLYVSASHRWPESRAPPLA